MTKNLSLFNNFFKKIQESYFFIKNAGITLSGLMFLVIENPKSITQLNVIKF